VIGGVLEQQGGERALGALTLAARV
jgi:hypothetical protein